MKNETLLPNVYFDEFGKPLLQQKIVSSIPYNIINSLR